MCMLYILCVWYDVIFMCLLEALKGGNCCLCCWFIGDKSFKWAGSGAQLFSQQTPQSGDGDQDANDSHDEGHDDDGYSADNIHFEPIVQLPESVDLKTGEEDEEAIYRQRAKLYRFDDNAWKERGTGEMKILKNPLTGLYTITVKISSQFYMFNGREWLDILWCSVCLCLTFVTFFVKKYFFSAYQL